jgi:hypothetical protein
MQAHGIVCHHVVRGHSLLPAFVALLHAWPLQYFTFGVCRMGIAFEDYVLFCVVGVFGEFV